MTSDPSGAHGVETDVGEEDDARALQDAAPSKTAESAGVGGDVRLIIPRVDVGPSKEDEYEHHGDLERHDEPIHQGALLGALDEQEAEQRHDAHGGQVDEATLERRCHDGLR